MANDFSARQPRRKYCQFCKENTEFIDYKDTQLLRKYMTDRGKIKPRRVTGACAQHRIAANDGGMVLPVDERQSLTHQLQNVRFAAEGIGLQLDLGLLDHLGR